MASWLAILEKIQLHEVDYPWLLYSKSTIHVLSHIFSIIFSKFQHLFFFILRPISTLFLTKYQYKNKISWRGLHEALLRSNYQTLFEFGWRIFHESVQNFRFFFLTHKNYNFYVRFTIYGLINKLSVLFVECFHFSQKMPQFFLWKPTPFISKLFQNWYRFNANKFQDIYWSKMNWPLN